MIAGTLRDLRIGRRLECQNFAASGMVRGADQPFALHALNEIGSPVIADRKPPLNVASRNLAIAQHDGHGAVVEAFRAVPRNGLSGLVVRCGRDTDAIDVAWRTLMSEELGDGLYLGIRDQRSVHARHLPGP